MLFNPGGLVYGLVTVGGVLAAESAINETYRHTVEAAVVALVLYWLAHAYAEFTQARALEGAPLKLRALLISVRRELSILMGAAVPLAALIICWIGGASLTTAVDAATWTAAGAIVVTEMALGLRSRVGLRDFAAQTGLGVFLGLLVIALRTLLH